MVNPPKLEPHVKLPRHSEAASAKVGGQAKANYCTELDALVDSCNRVMLEADRLRQAVLECRRVPFQVAPVDNENAIVQELRRLIRGVARIQLLHAFGVNTGPRPPDSRHFLATADLPPSLDPVQVREKE